MKKLFNGFVLVIVILTILALAFWQYVVFFLALWGLKRILFGRSARSIRRENKRAYRSHQIKKFINPYYDMDRRDRYHDDFY